MKFIFFSTFGSGTQHKYRFVFSMKNKRKKEKWVKIGRAGVSYCTKLQRIYLFETLTKLAVGILLGPNGV